MAAKYFAILTNLGAAKLANATALGTQLEITHMAVGDGGGGLPIPNPAQTALIGERRRAAINLLTIDPLNNSQIISEQVIPEDVGGWWIREVGLFDKDGSLVAIANCPETYKPQLQEGSGRTQTIRVILIVSSTQSVSLKIDPSVVLATRKYVDDNVIEVRAYAEQLMASHIDAVDPHSQYTKKANNGSDIQDKEAFRTNLGLKSAALRDVGVGANQIPDMNSFSAVLSIIGSEKAPGLAIKQWVGGGLGLLPAGGSRTITLPFPFPSGILIAIPFTGATAPGFSGVVGIKWAGRDQVIIYNSSMTAAIADFGVLVYGI
ncbi:phage tail protein [Plesiomonas shigelloides]|uniref:Phage tail fibre protein N-terminal domain-containing protein n=1 Tax=Plesiomonas shigelloides 302-73 TaxID=1315976 RepID=R8ANA7_PLESH|nr:phage tail protein [Plesiomonas shigelloides]EON87811.1 hypothetical protein PLESHI_14336 [Plesiomonas shigelloides 302-73]